MPYRNAFIILGIKLECILDLFYANIPEEANFKVRSVRFQGTRLGEVFAASSNLDSCIGETDLLASILKSHCSADKELVSDFYGSVNRSKKLRKYEELKSSS